MGRVGFQRGARSIMRLGSECKAEYAMSRSISVISDGDILGFGRGVSADHPAALAASGGKLGGPALRAHDARASPSMPMAGWKSAILVSGRGRGRDRAGSWLYVGGENAVRGPLQLQLQLPLPLPLPLPLLLKWPLSLNPR